MSGSGRYQPESRCRDRCVGRHHSAEVRHLGNRHPINRPEAVFAGSRDGRRAGDQGTRARVIFPRGPECSPCGDGLRSAIEADAWAAGRSIPAPIPDSTCDAWSTQKAWPKNAPT